MSDEMLPRSAFSDPLGDWFVEEMRRPRSRWEPSDPPPRPSDDDEPQPGRRPRRRWLLVANAALIVGAVAAGIIVESQRDTAPSTDEPARPDTNAPDPAPSPTVPAVPAEPLPFVGQDVEPGRYSTPLLGIPATLTIGDPATVAEANASSIAIHSPRVDDETDVPPLRWIFLARLGGWNTPTEAVDPSFRTTGSIGPDDVDAWLDQNDIVVLDRRETDIDGRPTTVIDVRVDPGGTGAPLDFARDPFNRYNDSCNAATAPCIWYRSVPEESDHGRGPRPDPVMHAGRTSRMWLIPVEGLEPILIEAAAPIGEEDWLDEVERTTVASIVFGDDAPPLASG